MPRVALFTVNFTFALKWTTNNVLCTALPIGRISIFVSVIMVFGLDIWDLSQVILIPKHSIMVKNSKSICNWAHFIKEY